MKIIVQYHDSGNLSVTFNCPTTDRKINIYFREHEIEPLTAYQYQRAVFDLSRIIILNGHQLIHHAMELPCQEGSFQTESWMLSMDTNKFLRALSIAMARGKVAAEELKAAELALEEAYRRKEFEPAAYWLKRDKLRKGFDCRMTTEMKLSSFRHKPTPPTVLTIVEILKHPNANNQDNWLRKSLSVFRKHLTQDQWAKLRATLSHYLTVAKVWACPSGRDDDAEIDFNGRIPRGCGFNGGIILRVDRSNPIPGTADFSVHT